MSNQADPYEEAYELGQQARKNGNAENSNPYRSSAIQPDSRIMDELHYQWYRGFWAIQKKGL